MWRYVAGLLRARFAFLQPVSRFEKFVKVPHAWFKDVTILHALEKETSHRQTL